MPVFSENCSKKSDFGGIFYTVKRDQHKQVCTSSSTGGLLVVLVVYFRKI